jgi:hypothetical protein
LSYHSVTIEYGSTVVKSSGWSPGVQVRAPVSLGSVVAVPSSRVTVVPLPS